MATEGARVRVVAFVKGGSFNRRLTELGINIGAELTVRQSQCGGMVLLRGESRIAIGFGMAHKIAVCPA
jgi:ferrous iron transport protein A